MQNTTNDFPFMTDEQVQAFWSASKKEDDKLTPEDKQLLRLGHSQVDLMYLTPLKESLLKGDVVPHSVHQKLNELYEAIDAAA